MKPRKIEVEDVLEPGRAPDTVKNRIGNANGTVVYAATVVDKSSQNGV